MFAAEKQVRQKSKINEQVIFLYLLNHLVIFNSRG
jgi:hypothetical protein